MVSDGEPTGEAGSSEENRSTPGQARGSSTGANIGAELAEVRERLGIQQTPVLIAAVILAVAAVLISTIAHIIYLTADGGGAEFDGQVTFQLALGAAIAAVALLVVVRYQSGPRGAVDAAGPDLKIVYGAGGLTAVFSLIGLFTAFDENWEAQDAWFSYARVFAFLLVGWLVIAKPIPSTVGTMKSAMVGMIALAVAGASLLIGQFMGMSDDYSTWVNGVAFQNLGIVATIVALGWFLGLQPKGA